MGEVPALPGALAGAIDRFVVPVVVVWFLVRWFALVPDDGKHFNALKATRQGSAAGIVGAALLLAGFVYFYRMPLTSVCQLGLLPAAGALLIGALLGAGAYFGAKDLTRKERITDANPNGQTPDDTTRRPRGLVVSAATAGALAAIVLYYSYPGASPIHQWLIWAFMSLLLFYRLSFFFGGEP